MSLNQAVAERLARIAQLQDLLGADRFRAISNDRAARAVEGLSTDIAELAKDKKALLEIDGIGPRIADKIIEFVNTGHMKELDELEKEVPAGLLPLLSIPGLGPKTVRVFWKEGGITDLAGLRRIIEDGSILDLPRMAEKSVQKLKESLALMEEGAKRLPLGLAIPVAESVIAALKKTPGVKNIAFAGSLRRGKETIGDIDILVATTRAGADAVSEAFRTLPSVRQVLVAGETKSSVRVLVDPSLGSWAAEGKEGDEVPEKGGPTVQVDLRVLPLESWGAALMYFTGSKEHNIRLRERALKKKYTLNEYGLFPLDDDPEPPQKRGLKAVAAKTEEEVYEALGVPYLPPEIREDRGEIDLTATPRLIELSDIKAELHAHTTASDGAMSIEELAKQAKARGFHTIAITDHSPSQVIANGLQPDRLLQHIEAIEKAREKVKGITILAGTEVDILADGHLDYEDKILAKLDIVVASPHTALSQEPEACTKRLLKAIANPHVRILGHPTGRLINRRPGLAPDMGKIIAAAKQHNVALEVNSHWLRLDLRDTHVKAAVDAGCLIAIDCDVHAPEDFDCLRYGVVTARRGWLTPDHCINSWPAKKLLDWLKRA
jgi:DNA polymerase (family 10)